MSPSGMNGGRLMGIDRYQDVPGRNWKRFFLSGLMTIPGCLPLTLTIGVLLFRWLVFLGISTLYWPQLVLFDQSPVLRLRNALLFTVKYFWATVDTALLQPAW